jgi:hypothetical protein
MKRGSLIFLIFKTKKGTERKTKKNPFFLFDTSKTQNKSFALPNTNSFQSFLFLFSHPQPFRWKGRENDISRFLDVIGIFLEIHCAFLFLRGRRKKESFSTRTKETWRSHQMFVCKWTEKFSKLMKILLKSLLMSADAFFMEKDEKRRIMNIEADGSDTLISCVESINSKQLLLLCIMRALSILGY